MAGENADLAEHMRKCQENETTGRRKQLTFLSNNFISKTLLLIRKHMVQSIVNEIDRCGGRFGLMMDGTQDVSCKEQISVAVKYINDSNDVVEHTVSFFDAKSTAGKELYEKVRTVLTGIGLKMCNIVGCSFDGAGNMRSDVKGVVGYIQKCDNADCMYTWCMIHRFNLVVKSAISSSQLIKQVLDLAEESAKIFRSSYKRMNVWIEVGSAMANFNSRRRLKLIGTTRWSSNQDAIDSIIRDETSLHVLIKSLLKICSLDNLKGNPLINAGNNLNLWLLYDNVVVTFILH